MQNYSYEPWEVHEDEFPKDSVNIADIAKFFVRYAILAPSSHNTQPWKFKVTENIVKIFPDFDRSLVYSDRLYRELHISLGCALANYCVAADYFGYETTVEYYPESDLENPAIVVSVHKKQTNRLGKELFPFVTQRTTNRNPYLDKRIPKDVLDNILRYTSSKLNITVRFIQDSNMKKKIIDLVDESILFAFNDTIFKDELSSWVRSNYTKKGDGMPLFGFGIPGLISMFAPFLIKNMPAQIQSKIDKGLLKQSDTFMVLSSKNDDKEAWIKTGEAYEYLCLACLKNGIATAPMAGVVEYDKTDKKLQAVLEITERPMFFARMGYTPQSPHKTPRRDLKDVLLF
jgi:hypothetical protein